MTLHELQVWHTNQEISLTNAAMHLREAAADKRSSRHTRNAKLHDAANFEKLAKFHAEAEAATTIINHHHQPPSSTTIINHHHQPPSSTTIINHHHQPPSSTTIINHHHQPPSSTTIINHQKG